MHNARLCAAIAKRTKGGLAEYLWGFTGGVAAVNTRRFSPGGDASWVGRKPSDATGPAAVHPAAEQMAAALKKEGFKYLGAITLTAFMQQVGIVNDHCVTCYKNPLSAAHRRCPAAPQPQPQPQPQQQQRQANGDGRETVGDPAAQEPSVAAERKTAARRPATPSTRKRKGSTAAPTRRSKRAAAV